MRQAVKRGSEHGDDHALGPRACTPSPSPRPSLQGDRSCVRSWVTPMLATAPFRGRRSWNGGERVAWSRCSPPAATSVHGGGLPRILDLTPPPTGQAPRSLEEDLLPRGPALPPLNCGAVRLQRHRQRAAPPVSPFPGLPVSLLSRPPGLPASPLRRQTKAHGPHGEEPRPDRRARHERPSDRHRVTFRGHELDGSAASKTTCSPRAATTRSTPRARAHAARVSTEHLTPWRLLPGGARLSDSARFDLESVEGRARLPAE